MRTLDDKDIDEVIEEPTEAQGMRVLGDDEIEEVQEPTIMDSVQEAASNFVNKESPLGPSLKDTAETALDFAHGAAEGTTLGALDEIGGMIGAGAEKALSYIPGTGAYENRQVDNQLAEQGFELPEESFLDTYSQYQDGVKERLDESSDRSPVANFAGNLAGSVATGVAAGNALGIGKAATKAKPIMDVMKDQGKMKAGLELLKRGTIGYGKAAPAIGVESAMNSEHDLVGENANPMGVLEDTAGGMAFGLPVMLGMNGIAEVAAPVAKKAIQGGGKYFNELVGDTPYMRKHNEAFNVGKERNINPASAVGRKQLLNEQTKKSSELTKRLIDADSKLGKDVGNSLVEAEKQGQVLDIGAPIMDGIQSLQYSYDNFKNIEKNSRGRQIFTKIKDQVDKGIVSPLEAKELLDDVDAFIAKFQKVGDKTAVDLDILDGLFTVRENLSNTIKDQVPSYRKTAERFADFRRSFIEPIIAGERPTDFKKVYYGNLREKEVKLFDQVNKLAIESTGEGSSVENVVKALSHAEEGLGKFKTNELARGKTPVFDEGNTFFNDVQSASDKAQMLRDMQNVKSPIKAFRTSGIVGGALEWGHGGTLAASNLIGRKAPNIAKLSKKVYNMPAEKLGQYAQKLENTPGLTHYGKSLRQGLENGDAAKKNAVLFSIMQNPNARLIFGTEDEEN